MIALRKDFGDKTSNKTPEHVVLVVSWKSPWLEWYCAHCGVVHKSIQNPKWYSTKECAGMLRNGGVPICGRIRKELFFVAAHRVL